MIYVTWTDENGTVLHGWDTCAVQATSEVDYKDSPLVHGPVSTGNYSQAQIVNLSITKFPGAGSVPTQAITSCKFKLQEYYAEGAAVTYQIPGIYQGSYSFCSADGGGDSKTYTGYSGSNSPSADYEMIGTTWPGISGAESNYGMFISQDGLCNWTNITDGDEIELNATAGGSENNNNGEITYGNTAQVGFRFRVPPASYYTGGTLQVLTALEYIFTE